MRNIQIIFIYYLCFLTFYLVNGYEGNIVQSSIFIQILFSCSSFYYISKSKYINNNKVFVLTFIFHLSLSVIERLLFIYYDYPSIFGYALDAPGYFYYAKLSPHKTVDALLIELSDTAWGNISDYGYIFYLFFLGKLMPYDILLWIVIIFNSFFMGISACVFYKTCKLINYKNANFITAIFSSFVFFVEISASGLKEVLFCMFIVLSYYNMIKYQIYRKNINLVYFIISCLATVFFRSAITLIIASSFILGLVPNEKNKKKYTIFLFCSLLIAPNVLSFLASSLLNIPLERVYEIADKRYNTAGQNASLKRIGDMLSSVLGPFPNFAHFQDSYHYIFSSLIKMFFNLPVIYVTYKIIKYLEYKYYSITIAYIMGVFFLIFTGTGLDMRYQIPFLVPFLLLYHLSVNSIKIPKLYSILYLLLCVVLTILYNQR